MDPNSLTRPLRVLRVCLHLLTAALLGMATARALLAGVPSATGTTVAAVVMGTVYAVGPALPTVGRTQWAAAMWLAVLGAVWLVLLLLTPDGVWLAFPMFFVQLHLLRLRWGLAAVAATTVLAIAGFCWHQGGFSPAAVIGPMLGAAVAVATATGYQALYRESEQRRQLIEQLTATRENLAAAEHTAGVLAERERLAREIHDTLAQGLSSIQLLLRAAERALPEHPDAAANHVSRARRSAQDNLAEARRFVRALAPPVLENESLPAALERLCITTADQTGIDIRFHLDGTPSTLSTPYEVALLRIAQSALANTAQHAQATRAEVTLTYLSTRVTLDVVDDGIGFAPDSGIDTGFGLGAMRARARALGGTLTVESASGQGTALAVSFAHQPDEGTHE